MIIIKLKPTTPGRRGLVKIFDNFIYKGRPVFKLCKKINSNSGRNNLGRITVRHKGGRCKRKYRIIDFKRDKDNVNAIVERIEYDPNRNAYIALLLYNDGFRKYIIYPKNLNIGDIVVSGIFNIPFKIGNCTILNNIPDGSKIHCLEIIPNSGAVIARSAGLYCTIISRDSINAQILLKSGKIKKINLNCRATIGEVGNSYFSLKKIGKAGINRLKGVRPTVRGVAMNPVDHPHGGGEGKTSGGRDPVTPWGIITKGFKTKK